ncbi:riboflavin kinase [Vibrio parahaemolyticus]
MAVHHYLRGEVKFTGLDGLKSQLQNDAKVAAELLTQHS